MRINEKDVERGVKRYFSKPKSWPVLVLIIIALVGIVISLYFIIIYSNVCEDEACFSKALVSCKRVIYIKDKQDTAIVTQYRIIGRESQTCRVNVKVLQVKKGSAELESLRNKDMDCYAPLGTYAFPEENLKTCHGSLREEIQEIIIQRMHSELLENVEEIKKELTEVLE